jgi:hypothetical protein
LNEKSRKELEERWMIRIWTPNKKGRANEFTQVVDLLNILRLEDEAIISHEFINGMNMPTC